MSKQDMDEAREALCGNNNQIGDSLAAENNDWGNEGSEDPQLTTVIIAHVERGVCTIVAGFCFRLPAHMLGPRLGTVMSRTQCPKHNV